MSMGGGQQQGAPQLTQSQTAGNTSQNTNTNMGPWNAQQPFLQGGFANGLSLLNSNSGIPTNPLLQQSWGAMNTAAENTPAFMGSGNNYLNSVLGGNFLSPSSNPYLAASAQAAIQPLINSYQTATAPQTDSSSEMANRYGSGEANQRTSQNELNLATGIGNTTANMYSNAYSTGINQMNSAASMAPAMLAANYAPALLQNQVGQQAQQLEQLQQQYPWLTAQQYQNIVGGNYGQSGTTSSTGTSQGTMTGQQQQPYYSNPAGSIFGGALGALGTAGALGFAPFTGGASLAAIPALGAAGMSPATQLGMQSR